MTREEAIKIIRREYSCVDRDCDIERSCGKCPYSMPSKEPILKAFCLAIEALKQPTSEDCISRQSVQDYIAKYLSQYLYNDVREAVEAIDEYIGELPSVKPQDPKTGRWEYLQYDYNPRLGNWHCSECRSVVIECVDKNEKGGIPLYKYCPQCGAKMVESQESEE